MFYTLFNIFIISECEIPIVRTWCQSGGVCFCSARNGILASIDRYAFQNMPVTAISYCQTISSNIYIYTFLSGFNGGVHYTIESLSVPSMANQSSLHRSLGSLRCPGHRNYHLNKTYGRITEHHGAMNWASK